LLQLRRGNPGSPSAPLLLFYKKATSNLISEKNIYLELGVLGLAHFKKMLGAGFKVN
jgi:hypothetical protein